MTDHNRERWEREAEEYVRKDLAGCGIQFKGAASVGYLAAAERWAPRWVTVDEAEALEAEGWVDHPEGWEPGRGDSPELFCMVPPAPDPPGGER